MKKSLLTLITFLAFVSGLKAQDVSAKIQEQFTAYSQLIIDKNFDKAADYTNEGMFEIVPKEQVIAAMKQLFQNPGLEYKMDMPTASDFQALKKAGGKYYVKFTSNTSVQMKFNQAAGSASLSAEDKKVLLESQRAAFTNKFGAQNVRYNEATGFFTVKAKKVVIASSDAKQTDWKFAIIENASSIKILENFIPASILQQP